MLERFSAAFYLTEAALVFPVALARDAKRGDIGTMSAGIVTSTLKI